jgi:uncharacterized membrane protein YfcA
MAPLTIAALGALMVATAFLSGLFGMAGGLILIGVLLALMPLPTAMVLHAITQMASNGWRAVLWRAHIRWRPVSVYLIGCALALGAWSITRYVPDKPIALLILGITPFMARMLPKDIKPNPDSVWQGTLYGSICMGLMLMTGVSGPLLDTFFLGARTADLKSLRREPQVQPRDFRSKSGTRFINWPVPFAFRNSRDVVAAKSGELRKAGTGFERREIIATKATCQVASHFTKLIYFGGIIDQAATLDPVLAAVAVAASMLGTTLSRRLLEAMSDQQFRRWANRLITTVASYYILYAGWLLVAKSSATSF